MRIKTKKLVSIMMSVLILVSLLVPNFPVQQTAEAAVKGKSGTIPAGGTPNPKGGLTGWGYRVGIITETLKPTATFESDKKNSWYEDKLANHFNNHYPNMQNSIMFIPNSQWENNAVIGWYVPSSGAIQYLRDETTSNGQTIQNYKMRKLASSSNAYNSPDSKNVYYSELNTLAPYSKVNPETEKNYTLNDMLGNGKWKKLVDSSSTVDYSTSNDTTNSMRVWNYILKDVSNIESRLKKYTADNYNESDQPAQRWEAKLKYIDLLMTIYTLSHAEQRKVYETEINRLVAGNDTLTKPVLLAIDTVSAFHAPGLIPDNDALFMPSTAYVQYAHGGTPKWDITDKGFNGGNAVPGGTKGMIQKAATESIKQLGSRKRLTDLASNERRNNGLAWAYGGVVGAILYTDQGGFDRWGTTSAESPVMELLEFDADTYGFLVMGSGPNATPADPSCSCSISTTEKGGTVTGDTIGKQVPIKVDMDGNDDVWNKYLLSKATTTNPATIKITITRTGGSKSPKFTPVKSAKKLGTFESVSNKVLLSWIKGDDAPLYNDDLSDYAIADGETIKFEYKAHVEIKVGSEPVIVCGDTDTIPVTFNKKPEPDPEKGYYRSTPSYWSEIKEGVPGSEEFEAMSGTPTNRPLYFASGGSEFIVDIETEYVPEATSTRTYRSYYTGGVPSEFKLGDQAGNYTVPAPAGANSSSLTVNAHTGGSVTATWSGVTPYTGNLSWRDHSSSGSDKWDDKPYEAALKQANDWAAAVNATVIEFTSASDKVTRKFNAWGASVSSSNTHPAGYVNIGQIEIPATEDDPGQPYKPTTGAQGTDGAYTITVTGTVPARIIDGPSSIYDLPGIEDTWKQTVTFDYMKINKVHVWKIDKSKVNGMAELIGTDEVTATVKQGDPTIFANIASSNTSAAGRLRYFQPEDPATVNQHDTVVWNEGPRSNKDDGRGNNGWVSGNGHNSSYATGIIYTNSGYGDTVDYHVANSDAKDKLTKEYAQFDKRRKTLTEVTAVSDFLILQTSSGDQSVIYFEKTSPKDQAQKPLVVPATSKAAMWDNNADSAAKWTPNQIHIGSYNGKYSDPTSKYKGSGSGSKVSTIFDTLPAGLIRTARPSSPLRLMETNLDVIDTIPNGQYVTGNSTVFYKYLSFHKGTNDTEYSSASDAKYGMAGQSFRSTYSNAHSKVNDIVIHNPVSTELAMVIPLDSRRDQRTPLSQSIGGNLQTDIIEYDRELNSAWRPNLLFNGDAEIIDSNTTPAGWFAWNTPSMEATFTTRVEDATWTISDRSSFEIYTKAKGDNGGKQIHAVYYQDIPAHANMNYSYTGNLSCHRCTGYAYAEAFNSAGTSLGTWSSTVNTAQTVQPFTVNFRTPANTAKIRVHLVKGDSLNGSSQPWPDYLFADDLSLINVDSQSADSPIGYRQVQVPNPDYVPPEPVQPPVSQGFGYTGTVQTYTAPYTGIYTFEVWGAKGGSAGSYSGGNGGYSKGDFKLTKGQQVNIFVGGKGTNEGSSGVTNPGGWNGGGSAYGYNYGAASGGGASDIRIGGMALTNRVIVAGGGGGSDSHGNLGGVGGGLTGGSSSNGASGGTQSSGYSQGQGQSVSSEGHNGGGGGGFYGGYSSNTHGYAGAGGSGYIGGVTNGITISGASSMPSPSGGMQIGQSDNGYIKISSAGSGGSGVISQPFHINNLTGLSYNGWGGNTAFTIPTSATVGDTAIIYTANGNSENNTSSIPVIPADFVKVGSASNGRQVYTKKLQSSDLGRSITITGGSSYGYVFFTVPGNYEVSAVSTSGSTVGFDSGGKAVSIVSLLYNATSYNGYNLFNNTYSALTLFTSDFAAGTSFPVPQGSTWYSSIYSYPHLIFVDNGTVTGETSGDTTSFAYTGAVQSYTAPRSGEYTLELWGAQGGASDGGTAGGKGGYSKGTINLTQGQIISIFVGGKGVTTSTNYSSGGWNGGGTVNGDSCSAGTGGGASDIRVGGSALNNRVIVAGGGGGSGGCSNAQGGDGGGTSGINGASYNTGAGGAGGTQNSGYSLGSGGNATGYSAAWRSGGGGGGYYGGHGGNATQPHGSGYSAGGGGGSGYIGGVTNGSMQTGINTGDGKVVITAPTEEEPVNQEFITVWEIDPEFNYSFPDEAYKLVERKTSPNAPATIPGGGSYAPGNFINLDYGFEIYFPNKGDFLGDSAWGIGTTTATRGKGFYGNPSVPGDEMDTTEWTQSKSVTFDFNVIYNGVMYTSGEEIDLPVNCNAFNCRYLFYLPLANSEAISAVVTYKAIAINGIAMDNENPTNRIRGSMNLDAKHSAIKLSNIDVVGRIGNMVIEDTGDFRFSNFFKEAVTPTAWIVPKVVMKVDVSSQKRIIGDTFNIRGGIANASPRYLDTYGKTAHLQKASFDFPLSPEKNSIPALRRQPMRLGYNVLADFQTIGNYYDSVQIIPYYYSLNLQTGTYTPVDIYMLVNSEYKPINLFGAAVPGWDSSLVYKYAYSLDWDSESRRRNYSAAEKSNTESVIDFFATTDDGGQQHRMGSPHGGKYPFGTAQIMYLQERNRTFIGGSETYGSNNNPGGTLPEQLFGLQGQRWHFTIGLPSSAVAVAHGQRPTQENIKAFRNNTSVLVMAADVVSIGDTFALRYESVGMNNPIQISGTYHLTTNIPYPVIAVYSSNKSSADDLTVSGTH